jgi:Na+-driven multidrug efflux pump
LQFCIIFLAIPYGFGAVAHDLISESLNFHDALEAKAIGDISQQFSFLVGLVAILLAAIFKGDLVNLYTSDPDIIAIIDTVWMPFIWFLFFMATNMVISGALSAISFA